MSSDSAIDNAILQVRALSSRVSPKIKSRDVGHVSRGLKPRELENARLNSNAKTDILSLVLNCLHRVDLVVSVLCNKITCDTPIFLARSTTCSSSIFGIDSFVCSNVSCVYILLINYIYIYVIYYILYYILYVYYIIYYIRLKTI